VPDPEQEVGDLLRSNRGCGKRRPNSVKKRQIIDWDTKNRIPAADVMTQPDYELHTNVVKVPVRPWPFGWSGLQSIYLKLMGYFQN